MEVLVATSEFPYADTHIIKWIEI